MLKYYAEDYLAMDRMRRFRNEADYSASMDEPAFKLVFTMESAKRIVKKFS